MSGFDGIRADSMGNFWGGDPTPPTEYARPNTCAHPGCDEPIGANATYCKSHASQRNGAKRGPVAGRWAHGEYDKGRAEQRRVLLETWGMERLETVDDMIAATIRRSR